MEDGLSCSVSQGGLSRVGRYRLPPLPLGLSPSQSERAGLTKEAGLLPDFIRVVASPAESAQLDQA